MLKSRPDLRRRPGPVPTAPFSMRFPVPPSARDYWRVWRNRAVCTTVAEGYRDRVAAMVGGRALFVGPIAVVVHWHRGAQRGDLDNRLKILLDALQGAVYANDSQIVELHAYRHEAPTDPRVEVSIEVRGP